MSMPVLARKIRKLQRNAGYRSFGSAQVDRSERPSRAGAWGLLAMSNGAKRGTMPGLATRCGHCGRGVGLLWYRGHSTLVNGPIETDGQGRIVLTPHQCLPRARPDGQTARRP